MGCGEMTLNMGERRFIWKDDKKNPATVAGLFI